MECSKTGLWRAHFFKIFYAREGTPRSHPSDDRVSTAQISTVQLVNKMCSDTNLLVAKTSDNLIICTQMSVNGTYMHYQVL